MTAELTKILTNYAIFAVIWYALQTFGYFKLLRKTPANNAKPPIAHTNQMIPANLDFQTNLNITSSRTTGINASILFAGVLRKSLKYPKVCRTYQITAKIA